MYFPCIIALCRVLGRDSWSARPWPKLQQSLVHFTRTGEEKPCPYLGPKPTLAEILRFGWNASEKLVWSGHSLADWSSWHSTIKLKVSQMIFLLLPHRPLCWPFQLQLPSDCRASFWVTAIWHGQSHSLEFQVAGQLASQPIHQQLDFDCNWHSNGCCECDRWLIYLLVRC